MALVARQEDRKDAAHAPGVSAAVRAGATTRTSWLCAAKVWRGVLSWLRIYRGSCPTLTPTGIEAITEAMANAPEQADLGLERALDAIEAAPAPPSDVPAGPPSEVPSGRP